MEICWVVWMEAGKIVVREPKKSKNIFKLKDVFLQKKG